MKGGWKRDILGVDVVGSGDVFIIASAGYLDHEKMSI